MTIQDKKFRVPIEMDREYAAQVGIDPSEITYIMLEGKRTPVYFVEIEDEMLYRELIPYPPALKNAIEVLQKQTGRKDDKDD